MIGRRTFLAVGAGVVVTACGSKGSSDSAGSSASPGGSAGSTVEAGFVVAARFPRTSLTPGSVRLPVSLTDTEGKVMDDGPDTLDGTVTDDAGGVVATVSATKHGLEMALPYWPFVVEIGSAGVYYLDVEGTVGEPSAFQIFDPAEVKIPTVGSELVAFDTPTTENPRGVDPICTRSPEPCPFHDVTLSAALATGRPVVYLIGTPAHCQTGTCAPGLEYLVEVAPTYADRAVFVHAEVYADAAGTAVAPAVTASGLDYEPSIFVTDATGTVVERIDIIWDAPDLTALLARSIS